MLHRAYVDIGKVTSESPIVSSSPHAIVLRMGDITLTLPNEYVVDHKADFLKLCHHIGSVIQEGDEDWNENAKQWFVDGNA